MKREVCFRCPATIRSNDGFETILFFGASPITTIRRMGGERFGGRRSDSPIRGENITSTSKATHSDANRRS